MKQKAHTRSSHLPATTWMLRKPRFGPAGYVSGPPGFYFFFFIFFYLPVMGSNRWCWDRHLSRQLPRVASRSHFDYLAQEVEDHSRKRVHMSTNPVIGD
jgi:hypothetical protein